MKIALFHPWIKSKGGAEKLILEYARNSKNQIDFYTWVYDKDKTFPEFKDFKVIEMGPKWFKFIARKYLGRGIVYLFFILFSKIPLKDYNAFLISTGGFGELITFINYKKNKTYAYVHTILRAAYEEDINWNLKYRYKSVFMRLFYLLSTKIYKILEKFAWKRINYPMFNSELSKQRAKNHNLLKNKKSFVVYSGIEFIPNNVIYPSKPYFVYVARFGIAKRQNMLIESWTKFVKKNPDYSLYLVGSVENPDYFNYLQELANKTKNINFKVSITNKELNKLYENCIATIYCPFAEDLGLVAFEGLAKGKPLIASEYGGYTELLKDCPGVILFKDYKDIEKTSIELNKSLQHFVLNKDKYISKSKNIMKYVSNIHRSWKDLAKIMDDIIK